ncbi:MAG TPA: carboxypeptidase-like regulatory domain-containing protein, partial [Streptosporangiaceae bacterium]|nr:carboxypeptidase-like regulatory domain-containing protein [Streptosporangiaceae bacterium]
SSDDYATAYLKATQILTSLRASLNINTVRLGLNEATVAGPWWPVYGAVVQAATDQGMNVILGYWPPTNGTPGTVIPCADGTFEGCYPVPDYTPWWAMWQQVIDTFASYGNVYLEPINEAAGYSDAATGYQGPSPTQLADVDAAWLARYPLFPRGRVILGGSGGDYYLTLGHDPRLDGTLLSYHPYCSFGLDLPPIKLSPDGETAAAPASFPTEAAWTRWIGGQIAGNESRTVITEFGLHQGDTDFDGPRDGNNCVSYVYAVTDYARAHHVGLVYWDYGSRDYWSIATRTGDGTAASPYVTHIVNRSFVDRLEWGFGLGSPMAPPPSPPDNAPAGVISGRITDARGRPLAGVCAHVFTASSLTSYDGDNYAPAVYQACSDRDGRYSISGVIPGDGRYDVQFIDSRARYRPRWHGDTPGQGTTALKGYNHPGTPVSVAAGATTAVDATMRPIGSGITVTVGRDGLVTGTITVTNDNSVPLTGVTVTDSVDDPGARCAVAGGTGATIAASPPYPGAPTTAVFSYSCVWPRLPAWADETDTATVTWDPSPHVPGTSRRYTQPFRF